MGYFLSGGVLVVFSTVVFVTTVGQNYDDIQYYLTKLHCTLRYICLYYTFYTYLRHVPYGHYTEHYFIHLLPPLPLQYLLVPSPYLVLTLAPSIFPLN